MSNQQRPLFPRSRTEPANLGALMGATLIEASRKALDRSVELYGDPSTHLQDRVDAQNLIRGKLDAAAPLTPVSLVATELVELGIALLRAQPGQERTVCALAMSRVAALASGLPEASTASPPPAESAPTPSPFPSAPKPTDNALSKLEGALKTVAPPPTEPPSSSSAA